MIHALAANVAKNAKAKVKELYNWNKIAQDTHLYIPKSNMPNNGRKTSRIK